MPRPRSACTPSLRHRAGKHIERSVSTASRCSRRTSSTSVRVCCPARVCALPSYQRPNVLAVVCNRSSSAFVMTLQGTVSCARRQRMGGRVMGLLPSGRKDVILRQTRCGVRVMLHQPQGKGTHVPLSFLRLFRNKQLFCAQGNFIYCLADDGALHCFSQDGAVLKTLAVRFAASSVQTRGPHTAVCWR